MNPGNQEETELHQRLAALAQENEQLRAENQRVKDEVWLKTRAMEAAVDGISLSDPSQPDNPLIYVNPSFERMTGYTRDEAIGRNCRFLQGPDTDPLAIAEIRSALSEERSCLVTLLNYRKDGTPFWNEFSISPIHDERGKVVSFVGIQTDITARMQAELALRENEAQLSGIIASAMDAIITVDSRQHVVLFNKMAENMFGYLADEVLGAPLDKLIPSRFREKHREHIHTFGEAGITNRFMASQRRISGLRADGTEFPVEASISQVEQAGNKLYTVIVRDISERLKAEEERNELQERIIQMQHALVQELSTPLIPISDDIVIMPLVGSVDSLRAQNVMETLLNGVEQNRAHIAILDITGVPIVDTQVANTLIQSAQAVRLLGATVVLTGIGPDIAQTLVGLGVDLSGIITHGSLQAGISYAMRRNRK